MATINVTSTADSGAGTLRQAITDLNAQAGSHTITFTGLTGTITLASALPAINKSMTITGPGLSSLTISGNNLYRVFDLGASLTISISGLTIANGKATAAGIYNNLGAGIRNGTTSGGADLTINNCYFTGCNAGIGGAISSYGYVTVTNTSFVSNTGSASCINMISGTSIIGNCTFYNNTGVAINAQSSSTIYNSTFNGNSSSSGHSAINFDIRGSASLLSSTISGNASSSSGYAGAVYLGEYCSLTLKNTIISGNTGVADFNSYNSNRSIASAASNIIGTISTASATSAARVIGDPLLGTLQNNGGTTQTMAVGAGSPAINAGNATASNASPVSGLDQRGTARSASTPTIGAFEYTGSSPPTVSSISPSTGTALGGTSVTITGANLTGASSVTIGGVAATSVTVVNSTTITATTPAGTVGTASVLVTTSIGTNASNTLFTYFIPPNTVRIKRSSTASVSPASLLEGELAANIIDQKLWIGSSSKTPVLISDYNKAGGSGTVTSVSMTVPTGLTITGSPVTTSGTLAVTLTAGYSIPLTASQTNWDSAYTNRITSLTTTGSGAATLVSNVLNIPTPSAATFTSLTVTGSSGSSTLSSGVLNVPTYTLAGLGGIKLTDLSSTSTGLTYTNTTGVFSTTSGYAIPTTAKQTNWDTAYSSYLQWDGGSTNLVAATGRTSLGATTIGSNMLTLVNPTAITFPRFNADNTVSTLDAATYRTAIGAGTSSTSGTVTSVAALTLGTTGTDLSSTVATGTVTPVITLNVPTASATNRGALSSSDWSSFNTAYTNRITSLTVTGSSGAATLTSNTLNIPTYTLAGLGGIKLTDLSSSATGLTYTNTTGVFSFTAGYSIPTTTKQGNWDTAYSSYLQWDGGSTNLVASTGRTSLGATTVGSNLFTLTNPSAVTFPRFNLDNTVSALDAATFRTAIGAGTSSTSGTVTSVAITVPTGLSVTGTPITASGTLAVTLTAGYSIPTTSSQTTWDTAYTNRITSLTTTGSSGSATLTTNTLNIPTYTLSGLGGQASSTSLTSLAGLTYVSASFVKMTATGTFSLDTNSYVTTSGNAATATSATSATTATNLANGDAGQLPYNTASGATSFLAAGTSGQVLQSNATSAPSWANIGMPTGAIMPYAASSAPTGYLICDGTAVSRSTYASLFSVIAPSKGSITITIASPSVLTLSAHGFQTGDIVYLTTTGALPTGLTANTLYYIINVTSSTFRLATSAANATASTAINTSGTQSGTHTLYHCPYGLGDGSTTFNVPNLLQRIPMMAGSTGAGLTARVIGTTYGTETHTLAAANIPTLTTGNMSANSTHTHTSNVPALWAETGASRAGLNVGTSFQTYNTNSVMQNADIQHSHSYTNPSPTAVNHVSPILTINYIIKT